MVDLGVSEADRQAVLSATAAVLHIGNITFDETESTAGSGSMVSSSPTAYAALMKAAELLKVTPDRLSEDLCTLTIRNPRETIRKTLNVQAAQGVGTCGVCVVHGRGWCDVWCGWSWLCGALGCVCGVWGHVCGVCMRFCFVC